MFTDGHVTGTVNAWLTYHSDCSEHELSRWWMLVIWYYWSSMRAIIDLIPTFITGADTTEQVGKKSWNGDFSEIKSPGIACITVRLEGCLKTWKRGWRQMKISPCFPLFQRLYWMAEGSFLHLGEKCIPFLLLKFMTAILGFRCVDFYCLTGSETAEDFPHLLHD